MPEAASRLPWLASRGAGDRGRPKSLHRGAEGLRPELLTARLPSGGMVRVRFDEGDAMSDPVGIAGDRIRSFVERIEQLETDLQEINERKILRSEG